MWSVLPCSTSADRVVSVVPGTFVTERNATSPKAIEKTETVTNRSGNVMALTSVALAAAAATGALTLSIKESAKRRKAPIDSTETELSEKEKKWLQSGAIYYKGNVECPLADVRRSADMIQQCPFHTHAKGNYFQTWRTIPLDTVTGVTVCENETKPNRLTEMLLRNIGGGDRIREICTRFYARAFTDFQLAPFFFNSDGATNHGKRLADWIIEHMGGEGTPWLDSGRWNSREPIHQEAWNSNKR